MIGSLSINDRFGAIPKPTVQSGWEKVITWLTIGYHFIVCVMVGEAAPCYKRVLPMVSSISLTCPPGLVELTLLHALRGVVSIAMTEGYS